MLLKKGAQKLSLGKLSKRCDIISLEISLLLCADFLKAAFLTIGTFIFTSKTNKKYAVLQSEDKIFDLKNPTCPLYFVRSEKHFSLVFIKLVLYIQKHVLVILDGKI